MNLKKELRRASLIALTAAPLLAFGACPPDPDAVCRAYHGQYAVWTGGGCAYGECFEMSYAEAARAHTMGDETLFPRQFFVWTVGTPNPEGMFPCLIEKNGGKWRTELPPQSNICRMDITVSGQVYFEHFVSNPPSGCLGWVECTVP